MKRRTVFMMAASAVAFAQAPPVKTKLKVGDAAPDFELSATDGKKYKLSDFRGNKSVVLAFFPAAFTGGCTKEITAYTGNVAQFEAMGAQVIGVSTDNLPSLKYWADNVLSAKVPLGSDFLRKVSTDYGVLQPERGIANRATFVIDTTGKIQFIEEGSQAVDISGAQNACSRLKKS